MSLGPGKYDRLLAQAREQAKAEGGLLIIFGGEHGDGFSMHAAVPLTLALPAILRMVADDIERDQLELWQVH